MPELVEHGVSGLVVRPEDPTALASALEQLYRNREWLAEMGKAARERISRQFHTSQTVKETNDMYLELLGQG